MMNTQRNEKEKEKRREKNEREIEVERESQREAHKRIPKPCLEGFLGGMMTWRGLRCRNGLQRLPRDGALHGHERWYPHGCSKKRKIKN